MPLKAVYATIEIHDQVAITTVIDEFLISGQDSVDAIFHARLPLEASVSGFGVWRDEEYVPFAMRAGEQGGPGGGAQNNAELRNFLGANSFTMRLGDLPPGRFRLQLQFAELLPYDYGVVSEFYPLSMGDFATRLDTLSLSLSVASQRRIANISCVGVLQNQTNLSLGGDRLSAEATLNLSAYTPNSDWRLNIRFDQEDIGAWLYTHRSDTTEQGYFMLVVEPGIVDEDEQVQKFFTFVFDRSGSMSGVKMTQARAAATNCLTHLLRTDYFNIIDFATNVNQFRAQLVQASAGNLDAARRYIEGLQPAGATNIHGALTRAVRQNMGERTANQIVFITDGQPTAGESWDPDTIRAAVANANEFNARIFSFGIGQDLNRQLLEGLAADNRGRCYIINENQARIDTVVAQFYRSIATPTLVNPRVVFGAGLEIDSIAPGELQDVSAGHQLYFFGRYYSYGEFDVALEGTMADGDTTFDFENVSFPRFGEENAFVPRMWAKATIDDLLDWIRLHGEQQRLINKIIELSLRYGILTPYTEFEEPPTAVDPPALANVAARPLSGGLELTWEPLNVASSVFYNVYRADGIESPFRKLNDRPLTEPRYFDAVPAKGMARYKVEMLIDGRSVWSDVFDAAATPAELTLSAPYPNPFNAETGLSFYLPEGGQAKLIVYNASGKLAAILLDDYRPAGWSDIRWSASSLPAGVYLLQLEAGGLRETRKAVLMK